MKQCRSCKAVKPLDDFYEGHKMKDGRMNTCKACHNAYSRENEMLKKMARLAAEG